MAKGFSSRHNNDTKHHSGLALMLSACIWLCDTNKEQLLVSQVQVNLTGITVTIEND